MKKEITVGQIIAIGATFIIALATGWLTMSNKVAVVENELKELRSQQDEYKIEYRKSLDELKWGIQDINGKITELLVQLQNKKNRD